MPKLTINVTEEQHMQIKILASLNSTNIKNFILDKVITRNKKPSMRLLEAINESKNKDDMNTYKTIEELFRKIS